MLTKLKGDGDQTKDRKQQQKRKFKLFLRITRSGMMVNPYEKMKEEEDAKEKKAKDETDSEIKKKGKENHSTLGSKEGKEKKKNRKKRAWKRFRQVALTTCRCIGMGAAHLSPATAYSSPEYYVDPRYWDKSFSSSYKYKAPHQQTAHWTNTMVFSSW